MVESGLRRCKCSWPCFFLLKIFNYVTQKLVYRSMSGRLRMCNYYAVGLHVNVWLISSEPLWLRYCLQNKCRVNGRLYFVWNFVIVIEFVHNYITQVGFAKFVIYFCLIYLERLERDCTHNMGKFMRLLSYPIHVPFTHIFSSQS